MLRRLRMALLLILVFLAAVACTNACGDGLPEAYEPCLPVAGSDVDPCDPDAEPIDMSAGLGSLPPLGDAPVGLREMLDGQKNAWVAHLVLRATYMPNTTRCTSGDRLRMPDYMVPAHVPQHEADELEYSLAIKCYIDIRVGEHIVSQRDADYLTVMAARFLYWPGEYAPETQGQTEQDVVEDQRIAWEGYVERTFAGREQILFLGPPLDLSSEAWRVLGYWDVQTTQDGIVIAVHPDRNRWRDENPSGYRTHSNKMEMTLPNFATAVTTAHQARVTAYGGRIGSDTALPKLIKKSGSLRRYMRAVGAYDEGETPPAQPPQACGLAVSNHTDHPDLTHDCHALLDSKAILKGNAGLRWQLRRNIEEWTGITIGTSTERITWGSAPVKRVTKVLLPNTSLDGTIPASMGRLTALTHLDLSNNALTGAIPKEIGWLEHLVEVRLSGNKLTGCIPDGLRSVATNDFASTGLSYCPPEPGDYDKDNDGLVEISSIKQLNAVRFDLDGDGRSTDAIYAEAFPGRRRDCTAPLCLGYELAANLDLGGQNWQPIGTKDAPFKTAFHGSGYTISNVTISRGTEDHVGLFGVVGAKATLNGIVLLDVSVTGQNQTGALAGMVTDATIKGSSSTGRVTGRDSAGGLVGKTTGATHISYSSSEATVYGSYEHTGGLVGKAEGGTITYSYATGDVTSTAWHSGGLVGRSKAAITQSYALGDVHGKAIVGGLVGYNEGQIRRAYAHGDVSSPGNKVGGLLGQQQSGGVHESYSIGKVTGTGESVSGLIGVWRNGDYTDSMWDTETSGTTTTDAGRGQTSAQLRSPTNNAYPYQSWSATAWDYGTSGQYPALKADWNGDGTATWQEFGPQRTPLRPTIGDVERVAVPEGLDIDWTAPSWDGGSAVTSYDVRHIGMDAHAEGSAAWTVVKGVWTSGSSGALAYGLSGSHGRRVQLRAVNANGAGVWSDVAEPPAGVSAFPSRRFVDEGFSTSFSIVLLTRPSGDVTVTSTSNNAAVTAPGPVTFTPDNWSTPQRVHARAEEDDNAEGEVARITVSASGGGYDDASGWTVIVTVNDDEAEA